jgi:TonB-linked SusC/RagA family outer membrane protein
MTKICSLLILWGISIGIQAQTTTIRGVVTQAEDNSPLPGVSVIVAGSNIGTITDFEGHYSINVPTGSTYLRFTFVGLRTEEIEIGSDKVIDLAMVPDSEILDEVVVVGYGTKRKGSITGSISTVSSDVIGQIPVGSFDAALQGQVAGMQVITSSGAPGASATVRIRGVSSINAGTSPLYIMDGVQITAGDFSTINANDIENISILKDASATSIYGSKGANGVIIISSKRGKNRQRTEINYRSQFGSSVIARDQFDMMNSAQKIDYEIDLGIRSPDNPENDSLKKVSTNWRDELFRNAPLKSHEISVRGGNEKTAFYISGGYYDQDGIQYRSGLKRYSARINLDHKASQKLTVGTYLTAGFEEVNNAVYSSNSIYNLAFVAYLANPYTTPYRPDGSFSTIEDGLAWANPIQQLELNTSMNDQLKIVGNVFAEYTIIPGLTFRTTVGTDFSDNVDYSYLHPESAWGATNSGEVYRAFSRNFRLTNTNLLSFDRTFGIHGLNIYLGQETIGYRGEFFASEGFSLPNNILKVMSSTSQWGFDESRAGSITEYSVASFFGNASYDFNRKYYFDISYRRDASSRFGEDVRWADFWSVGAQWDLLKERFMNTTNIFSRLRIRGSTGTAGNYNIGNYLHLQTYSFSGSYYDMNASFPALPGNPGLTWEKVLLSSLTLDFQILNKYGVVIETYHKLTTDMLFELPYSYTTGFSSAWANVGNMLNKGVEVAVNFDLLKLADLTFNLNANVAYNHNEVTELYDEKEEIPSSPDSDWFHAVGRPYGSWKMVEYAGVNAANGARIYLDAEGNPTDEFLVSNARYVDKSWIAPWQGGLTGTLNYKWFAFSAFFSFIEGKYMVNNTRFFTESNGQFGDLGQSVKMLEAWKNPGDISEIPKADFTNYFDTRLLEDASFMRLKNLTLSFQLPPEWAGETRVFNSLRIFAQGQNLFTWSKYLGFDPEFDSPYELGAYPHVKTITIGLDAGF